MYPSNCPSLYTRIVYVTISPTFTDTGVFGWLYVAVVLSPVINFVTSTSGSLLVSSSVPFISDTNFLNEKS